MYVNKVMRSLLVFFFLFILPSPFHASQGEGLNQSVAECVKNPEACSDRSITPSNDTNELEQRTPSVTFWDFLKMIFALLFVLVLIYGALRFINKRNKWFESGRSVENIGGTNLGNNKSLQLVKVGNSILVVGVGDSINLLKEITDKEERDLLIQIYKERNEAMAFPTETLVGFIKKIPVNKREENAASFSSVLKDQIGQLTQDRKKKIKELDDKEGFKQ